jgi:uncharacterized protein YkwD
MQQRMEAVVEGLESRRLLAAVQPSAVEQYVIELINRARANPQAEANRFGVALNEGLAPGTITTTPKQPVAPNPYITDAARKHSQWMILTDTFAHNQPGSAPDDPITPGDRMLTAGYEFIAPFGWGENIAWSGTTGNPPEPSTTVPQLHQDLFVDEGIVGRGHRINILADDWKEIGAGVVSGGFTVTGQQSQVTYNAVMLTTDFGYSGQNTYLTGVAYTDQIIDDNFYSVGEGLGNITVTATRNSDGAIFTTKTAPAGGYALALPAGTYQVRATGTGLGGTVIYGNVTISNQNVKRDFRPELAADDVPPTATVSAAAVSTGGAATHAFTVTFDDNTAIDVSTLDSLDILVTGPGGYSQTANLISVNNNTDGRPRTAVYRVNAPGGRWDLDDNGTYAIVVRPNQVSDTNNNFMASAQIGTFQVQVPYSSQVMKPGGDYNADGKTDILWRDYSTGQNELWLMDGQNRLATVSLPDTANLAWQIVGGGDFNADGKDDILFRNTSTGTLAIWAMNGVTVGVFNSNFATVKNKDWEVVGTGRFNGDNHTDIIWHNSKTKGTLVWLMNGSGGATSVVLPTVRNIDWTLAGVGDMNNDDWSDLVWRNTRTGANLTWRMKGTAILGTANLPTVAGTQWLLSGVADTDDNGTADLLWRNLNTGANLLWRMNGTTPIEMAGLPVF